MPNKSRKVNEVSACSSSGESLWGGQSLPYPPLKQSYSVQFRVQNRYIWRADGNARHSSGVSSPSQTLSNDVNSHKG